MSKIRIGKLALGLIIGSVAGVSAALLAAPQSGEKTRGMLLEKGVEFENKASETLMKSREKAKDIIESVRSNAEQVGGSIRHRLKSSETQISEIVAE
jgi:gas vesicle protein